MKTILKYSGLCFIFFLFLCININKQPVFSYFYNIASPATLYVQSSVLDFFLRSLEGTQAYSQKIFDNSIPKFKDSLNSRMSSGQKADTPADDILQNDKKELDELIKKN